jgi:hypothetical protein
MKTRFRNANSRSNYFSVSEKLSVSGPRLSMLLQGIAKSTSIRKQSPMLRMSKLKFSFSLNFDRRRPDSRYNRVDNIPCSVCACYITVLVINFHFSPLFRNIADIFSSFYCTLSRLRIVFLSD